MKTKLPQAINTVEEAKTFLMELVKNLESFHPEDSAHDILWDESVDPPTSEECDKLNDLMSDIYELNDFDPCDYLMEIIHHENDFENE